MERHVKVRIGRAGDRENEIYGHVEAIELDAKVRKMVLEPKGQHALRARAYSIRAEQAQGRSRWGILGRSPHGRHQYLSSERPTDFVRSACLGGGSGVK